MKEQKKRFRVTIPGKYRPGTAGHTDKSAREGHFVTATSVREAERIIRTRLGLSAAEPLDVQNWEDY